MKKNHTDWNRIWKSQMAASSAAIGGSDCARNWDDDTLARNYWKMALDSQEWIEDIANGLPIHGKSRILDIGAGPGTLTVPLANRAACITAVEPAAAMVNILHENIKVYGLKNVTCVPKRWEDIDETKDISPHYDVSIASFSLGMPDIRAAIEKMLRVTKGYIVLLWFAGPPSWDRHSHHIFKTLFNREYTGMPQADVIFNLLYQMGIYAHVDILPGRMDHYYDRLEDVVADFCSRMSALSKVQASDLEAYCGKIVENRDGKLVLPYTWQTMKLWWESP